MCMCIFVYIYIYIERERDARNYEPSLMKTFISELHDLNHFRETYIPELHDLS